VRDLILQSIAVLMQYNEYVVFIENLTSTSGSNEVVDEGTHKQETSAQLSEQGQSIQVKLVRGLLLSFDKKFWVTVTSILLRIWKACSFVLFLFVLFVCSFVAFFFSPHSHRSLALIPLHSFGPWFFLSYFS
jgi:hypothetical protein